MRITRHQFKSEDFVGGSIVLDFINTVTARDSDPVDWLDGFASFLDWGFAAGLLNAERQVALHHWAALEPGRAIEEFERIKRFRAALFETFAALSRAAQPPSVPLSAIEQEWKSAVAASHLSASSDGASIRVGTGADLATPRYELVLDAVSYLLRRESAPLKMCAGPDCAWLFLDLSKSRRRRWCSMRTCGNTAKARQHYRAHRRRIAIEP